LGHKLGPETDQKQNEKFIAYETFPRKKHDVPMCSMIHVCFLFPSFLDNKNMMKLSSRKQKADLPGVELRQLTLQHRLLVPPGCSFKMGQWNRGKPS